MTRTLLLAALVAFVAPASAQSLSQTDATFRADLETVARLTATAGLIHDQTGAFPATPFALLGSYQAAETGLRGVSLSSISVSPEAVVTAGGTRDGIRVQYNPLPRPYVSDDLLADVVITRGADGTYTATHELRRRADPDRGGRALPYDRAGRYRVDEAGGTLCVDVARVRDLLASGGFAAALPDLDGDGVPVEVITLDGQDRVLYTSGGDVVDA